MKPTPYYDMPLSEWLVRFGPALIAWGVLFVFFSFAGAVSDVAPTQTADSALAVGTMDDEVAAFTTLVLSETSTREPELRDAAIAAHEVLDPVGVGHRTTE